MIWCIGLTLLFFYLAYHWTPSSGGDYDFSPIVGCILFPIAAFLSMFVWFLWAIFR